MDKRRKVYPTYEEAKSIVKKMGIESVKQYKSQYRELGLPSNPNLYYENNGWKGWLAFFDKEKKSYPTYEEAKSIIQERGIKSQKTYKSCCYALGLPTYPETIYKDDGWVNWFAFFDKEKKSYPTYEEAKRIVQERGIKSSQMYMSQAKILGLPSSPHLTYKKHWISWADFLDKTSFPTYKEAQRIVQEKGIRSIKEYKHLCKELGLPVQPSRSYSDSGWISWLVFFSKEKKSYPTYEEAKRIVQERGITARRAYKSLYKTLALPSNPDEYFKNRGWVGWREFFDKAISPQKRKYNLFKKFAINPVLLKDAPLKVLYIYFSKFRGITDGITSLLGTSSYEERLNWVKEQLNSLKDGSLSKDKSSEEPDELSAMKSVLEENDDVKKALSGEDAERFNILLENYVHSVVNRELISEVDDK